jgi:predicted amidophosphoribosyltransferase
MTARCNMSNGELVCCISCGRDTRNKSGYCGQCLGGYYGRHGNKDDQRGRKTWGADHLRALEEMRLLDTDRHEDAE